MEQEKGAGTESLFICTVLGDTARLQELLEAGTNPNGVRKHLWSYLLQSLHRLRTASASLRLGIAEALLRQEMQSELAYAWTPLLVATWAGQTEVVRLLLSYGADVNFRDAQSGTALVLAVVQGQEEIARMLLAAGADVDAADGEGYTALLHTLNHAEDGLLFSSRLNSAMRDIPDEEDTPPAPPQATPTQRREMSLWLLGAGADVTACSNEGTTALHCAAAQGDQDMVVRLLERGADLYAQCKWMGDAFHAAAMGSHLDIMDLLRVRGADLNAPDQWGSTPLMGAVACGDARAVAYLLEQGAQVEAVRPDDGYTALFLAVANNQMESVRLLLQSGAEVDARDKHGATPLMHAARAGYPALAALLLQAGADIAARSQAGNTALKIAQGPPPSQLFAERWQELRSRQDDVAVVKEQLQAKLGETSLPPNFDQQLHEAKEKMEATLNTFTEKGVQREQQGRAEVVALLLQAGAQESATPDELRSPKLFVIE